MIKKISIIGIGMDGILTITREAEDAVKKADLLIGASRMLTSFEHLQKPMLYEYRSEKIIDYIRETDAVNIAVLMSGDCGFYSGAQKLSSLSNEFETEVLCGISSPVYFSSKINIPWHDMHFVSLHGKSESIARAVSAHEKTFFLLGGDITAAQLCQRLCEFNLGNVSVYIGENLSMKNERILCGKACELTSVNTDNLCVAVTLNPHYEKCGRTGISDCEFIRGKVPMTKSEVRSVLISKLEVKKNDVCWDIGSGTGSVSVEMAIQCENGKVFSVDKNPDAVALTDENRRKFSCDNIEIASGDAAEIVSNLPKPDCVFVGGSGGMLGRIIDWAYCKNTGVRLAVTAVSIETLGECLNIFEKKGFEAEVMQIAVTRTHKIGSHTMFAAENPVFIIKRKFV